MEKSRNMLDTLRGRRDRRTICFPQVPPVAIEKFDPGRGRDSGDLEVIEIWNQKRLEKKNNDPERIELLNSPR